MSYLPTKEELQAYRQIWNSTGATKTMGGREAVSFFIKSGVPVPVLKHIWDIASQGEPSINPQQFCISLRLIAMAQNGEEVSAENLEKIKSKPLPMPRFDAGPQPPQKPPPQQPNNFQFPQSIPAEAKQKYASVFQRQKVENGRISGLDAAAFFKRCGLDKKVLRTIWQLADVDNDGFLTLEEFQIAMHLITLNKGGNPLPESLPPGWLSTDISALYGGPPLMELYDEQPSFMPPVGGVPLVGLGESSPQLLHNSGDHQTHLGESSLNISSNNTPQLNETLQNISQNMQYGISGLQEEAESLRTEKETLTKSLDEICKQLEKEQEEFQRLLKSVQSERLEVQELRQEVGSKQQELHELREKKVNLMKRQVPNAELRDKGAEPPALKPKPPLASPPKPPTDEGKSAFDQFAEPPENGADSFEFA